MMSRRTLSAEPDATVVADPMITTSLRLPNPMMDAIRSAAEALRGAGCGVRATVLMREWLEQRLAQQAETGEQMIPIGAVMAFLVEAVARNTTDRHAAS
jgi:hypothetical protein